MTRPADSFIIFIARIALAILFLWGGAMKLLGYAGFVGYLHSKGVPYASYGATGRGHSFLEERGDRGRFPAAGRDGRGTCFH